MVLVSLSTAAEAEPFFAQRWPSARVICDPERQLYQAFGLKRGSLAQIAGPGVWLSGLGALLSGHGPGRPQGDVMQMSGAMLIEAGQLSWQHLSRHSADLPDFTVIGSSE